LKQQMYVLSTRFVHRVHRAAIRNELTAGQGRITMNFDS